MTPLGSLNKRTQLTATNIGDHNVSMERHGESELTQMGVTEIHAIASHDSVVLNRSAVQLSVHLHSRPCKAVWEAYDGISSW